MFNNSLSQAEQEQSSLLASKLEQVTLKSRNAQRQQIFNQNRFWMLKHHEKDEDTVEVPLEKQFEKIELEDKTVSAPKEEVKARQKRKFSKLFQIPSYICSLNQKIFLEDYFVFNLPLGNRCFVSSANGHTTARSINGNYLKKFQSLLPGGHRQNKLEKHSGQCILDCFWSKSQNVFYIFDIVQWGNMELYELNAEFRYFWIQGNLKSQLLELESVSARNEVKFYFLKTYQCNAENIRNVYYQQEPYLKCGLALMKKDSSYLNGVNEDFLVWKDKISQHDFYEKMKLVREVVEWVAITEKSKERKVKSTLRVDLKSRELSTLDNEKVGRLSEDELKRLEVESEERSVNVDVLVWEMRVDDMSEEHDRIRCKFELLGKSSRVLED